MRQPSMQISDKLLAWYDRHRRALPWRALAGEKADPYRVLVSEFMLQQTVAATVMPYFERFTARWPDFAALAAAPVDDVMKEWAGLGYYARARNLHALAKAVVSGHDGLLPSTKETLLALPGIGPYTAGAVLAIAFDQPSAAVDGNVERVVSRLFAVAEPLPASRGVIGRLAADLVPRLRPGDFAQAMMDLGATVCTPRSPKCMLCPLSSDCEAVKQGIPETLPRKATKKRRPTRFGTVYWAESEDGQVMLARRPPKGLLGGMLGFPGSPWLDTPQENHDHAPFKADWILLDGEVLHTFTHFDLVLRVACARLESRGDGIWHTPGQFGDIALPSVMRKVHRHVSKSTEFGNI